MMTLKVVTRGHANSAEKQESGVLVVESFRFSIFLNMFPSIGPTLAGATNVDAEKIFSEETQCLSGLAGSVFGHLLLLTSFCGEFCKSTWNQNWQYLDFNKSPRSYGRMIHQCTLFRRSTCLLQIISWKCNNFLRLWNYISACAIKTVWVWKNNINQ